MSWSHYWYDSSSAIDSPATVFERRKSSHAQSRTCPRGIEQLGRSFFARDKRRSSVCILFFDASKVDASILRPTP